MYRIFTRQNFADTCRDPDNIVIKDIGFVDTQQEVIEYLTKYADEHFHSRGQLNQDKDGSFTIHDMCSYGETLIGQKIIKLNQK